LNESWKPLTNVGKHRHINALYFLKGLLPDTLYYIRAFLPHLGNYTAITEGRTCPTVPPPVAALREGGAGPGWLDVRTKRYDVDEHEEGEPMRIILLADSEVAESLVNVSAKRSTEQTKAQARHASDLMLQDVVLPLWILVLVGGMSSILLLIAIAYLCARTQFCI
ncbi:Protein of unknown function, partial [Gryllus bimaculatus]